MKTTTNDTKSKPRIGGAGRGQGRKELFPNEKTSRVTFQVPTDKVPAFKKLVYAIFDGWKSENVA